jgi:hypothetical protein
MFTNCDQPASCTLFAGLVDDQVLGVLEVLEDTDRAHVQPPSAITRPPLRHVAEVAESLR